MSPGEETPEMMAACREASAAVGRYAQENRIPLYNPFNAATGPAPIVLVLAALIHDNQRLREELDELNRGDC